MDEAKKVIFRESGYMAIGLALCSAVIVSVAGLLSSWSRSIWLGGILGFLLAWLNFFFMSVGAGMAADRAEAGNPASGQRLIQISFLLRYVILFLLFFALIKGGLCNVFTLLLPLVCIRPVLTISEFFRKSGDNPS